MATLGSSRPGANRFLASLGPQTIQELAPHLERLQLARGDVLFEAGDKLRHVWFPETCVISLAVTMRDGGSPDAATVGREGMVGLMAAVSSRLALSRGVAQMPGSTLRLPASLLKALFEASPQVRRRCLCYVDALLAEVLQSSACSALHSVEARLCRWLLQIEDRTEGNPRLPLTHDFLAEMLGTHRTTITLATRMLQRAHMISYRRGQITVLDRAGLETTACECYATIREHYERLLPRADR